MDKFYRNRGLINLCQTGQLTQAPIAPSMEISQGRVSQRYGQFQEAGEAGLVVNKATGAPPKLTTEPGAQLPDLFLKGAEHYGFEGAVWTRLRVGEVIKPHFGVHYEVATIGLLLKPLGFTLQKPTRRDYCQHLARVTPWREETWPELKKLLHQRTNSSFR